MNANDRFYPVVQTPVGKVLLIGATMTVERERELFGKKVKTDERAVTHNRAIRFAGVERGDYPKSYDASRQRCNRDA